MGKSEEEHALVRKIDVLLMPLLTISYGLQFVSAVTVEVVFDMLKRMIV